MHGLFLRSVLAVAFAILAAPACSGDDGRRGGDGRGDFDEPSDFDRADCGGGPLHSVDLAGVWHADLSLASGPSPTAFRIDSRGGGGEFSALLFGAETDDVRRTPDDVFIRYEAVVDGRERVYAMDLCRVQDDGGLGGQIATCFSGQCDIVGVAAYPVEPLDEPEAENMTLVAEWEGRSVERWPDDLTLNVRHLGTVAYLARATDGLRIVDLADPARPADLGHAPTFKPDEYWSDVKIVEAAGGIYALLASSGRGVVVVDVSDPTAPAEVATFPDPPIGEYHISVRSVFTEAERAYTGDAGTGGLYIYDVADPARPAYVDWVKGPDSGTIGDFVHGLFVRDGVAYLDYWNLGLVVADTADPADPAVLGVFDDYPRRTSHSNWVTDAGGRRVAIHGDKDFDAHVRIVDVDPASASAFTEIGSFQTRRQVSVHNIMAVGELALVTYCQDGLRVLDLADPTEPIEIAHFDTWPGAAPGYGRSFFEGAMGVDYDAERDLILLADTHRGLLVLTMD